MPLTGTRNCATSSSGSMVAEMPIRCTGLAMIVSRSAIDSDRCVPRLLDTSECISSMIIHCRSCISGRKRFEAKAKPSDSGVVIRMCGGFRSIFWRSDCGVSPVRSPTLIS